jgi:hypothetical protein
MKPGVTGRGATQDRPDLDATRTENQRLAEQLTQAIDAEAAPASTDAPSRRPCTTSRTKKTSAT